MHKAIQQLPLAFGLAHEVSPATEWCQRWTNGRHAWRHVADGGFEPRRYDVAPIDELTAKRYVQAHHYSHSYPAARLRWGLWEGQALVGVAVLSVPARAAVLTNVFPDPVPFYETLELGRFVLADRVPGNGESWFLARVFREALREGVRGVVSFADPVARRDAAGTIYFPGHVGWCYQGSNALFLGRTEPRVLHLLPDGTLFNRRALAKLRNGERGEAYVARLLRTYGAPAREPGEPVETWLARALPAIGVRRLAHRGCYRYAFPLGATARKRALLRIALPRAPYPKRVDDLAA